MNTSTPFYFARYMKLAGFHQPCSLLFKLAAIFDQGNRTRSKQWLALNQKFPGAGYLKVLKQIFSQQKGHVEI